jgi:amino acid permease
MSIHQTPQSPSSSDNADSIAATPEGYSAYAVDTIVTAIRCILMVGGIILLTAICVLSKPATTFPQIVAGTVALIIIWKVWKAVRKMQQIRSRSERDLELGTVDYDDEEDVLLEERGRSATRPEAQALESHDQMKRLDMS